MCELQHCELDASGSDPAGRSWTVGTRALNAEELEALREYERAMTEEVIPEIVRVMQERAEIAARRRAGIF